LMGFSTTVYVGLAAKVPAGVEASLPEGKKAKTSTPRAIKKVITTPQKSLGFVV